MDFLSAMFDGRVLMAMGVYALLAATEPFLERWLERVFHDNPPALWFQEHLGIPLLRAACVVIFVYLAYPSLFGLREAPPLGTLLAAHTGATSTLLGIAFLVALLAPLVPPLHHHPEFVLPIQGMLATALLFDWLTEWLHMSSVSPWPGTDVMLLAGGGAWLMHRLARGIGRLLGESADAATGRAGYDVLAVHVTTMIAQLPVILIYGTGLAARIAI
ncbi:MAG TPA: hypothetical protein PJ986_03920 [Gammaproteobacteria bacterium]|nr:hypothetical protein [Gammaproteobacteria bacterium]